MIMIVKEELLMKTVEVMMMMMMLMMMMIMIMDYRILLVRE